MIRLDMWIYKIACQEMKVGQKRLEIIDFFEPTEADGEKKEK